MPKFVAMSETNAPLDVEEAKSILKRLESVTPDAKRVIQEWLRQRIVLKYLFDLFQEDEDGLRTQSDSVRRTNLDAAKRSVDMEDKK